MQGHQPETLQDDSIHIFHEISADMVRDALDYDGKKPMSEATATTDKMVTKTRNSCNRNEYFNTTELYRWIYTAPAATEERSEDHQAKDVC